MPLWQYNGKAFVKLPLAKWDAGIDAYIVCPGPSLRDVDASLFRKPGVMTLGVNTSYPYIKPDMWIGMDLPECYDAQLWYEPFPKIVRGSYRTEETPSGTPLIATTNTWFADVTNGEPEDMFDRRQNDSCFVWVKNTLTVAIHVAVWMGFRRIHLVGCDFNNRQRSYFDDRVLSAELATFNQRLYTSLVKTVTTLQKEAKRSSIHIVSCTPDSPMNKFVPFIPLEKALKLSNTAAAEAVKIGKFLPHAREAKQLRIKKNAPVYVCCHTPDKLYTDHAAELKKTLEAFKLQHEIVVVPPKTTWTENTHLKAKFIRSMFKKFKGQPIVWTDADSRIRAYPVLFDTTDADFGAHWFQYPDGREKILAGTMFFANNAKTLELVDAWIAACEQRTGYSDQVALGQVISQLGKSLTIERLPPAYTLIFDTMKNLGPPIIEHLQASRDARKIEAV